MPKTNYQQFDGTTYLIIFLLPPPSKRLHACMPAGRVAMLACLGTLVQTFYHLPDEVFSNPRPLAALSQVFSERPLAFWQIFLTLGALELTVFKQDTANKAPGDVGFGSAFIPDDVRAFLVVL